jgi:probable addiction module antidote protein
MKTIHTTEVFDAWFDGLKDPQAGLSRHSPETSRRHTKSHSNCRRSTMATVKLRKWDSAEYLKTDEDMALYLETCLEEAGDDAAFIAKALGNIARAKGMTQLARETGLGRESLYKALSGEGNPSFATILKVMSALGIKLHAEIAHTS